jgi:hypothetical protein
MTTEPAKRLGYALPQYSENGRGRSSKRILLAAQLIIFLRRRAALRRA